MQFDPEILYVQKLYFFMFLVTLTAFTSAVVLWRFGLNYGLLVFGCGIVISYIAMLRKINFIPPEKKMTAKRMARTISQDTSPLSIASFASQLYYYFQESNQAICLLEKFLPSYDPLVYTTLGDILLKEGKAKQALYILRDNPHSFIDPLLLATQGHALKQVEKIPEAAKMFERSLYLAKQYGLPHNGAHWVTQKLLTLSYIASIHHSLAHCYSILENSLEAKRHYRAGNRLLFDISLWRFYQPATINSAKNYTKSL